MMVPRSITVTTGWGIVVKACSGRETGALDTSS